MNRDQQMSLRQEAFRALLESLRKDAPPARKPAAAVLIETAEALREEPEAPCEDCAGTGGDGNAVEGWEPCSHCRGTGLEGTPSVLPPAATVPALIGAAGPIARRGVVSIGPGMFVRTGRRRS